MNEKIVYPFGWLAGHEGSAEDLIEALAIEMLGKRSNLQDRAARTKDDLSIQIMKAMAETLEEYAVILNVIFIQLKPEVWNPNAQKGLLELAEKYHLTFPEWMKNPGLE